MSVKDTVQGRWGWSRIQYWARARKGSARTSRRGTAWLVFDSANDLYQYRCYWMNGPGGDHMVESGNAATDVDAVAWAAARTPNARIRMPDHRTYWAGIAPSPGGFAGAWRPSRPEDPRPSHEPVVSELGPNLEPSSPRDRCTAGMAA
jgi:hypothetical protein